MIQPDTNVISTYVFTGRKNKCHIKPNIRAMPPPVVMSTQQNEMHQDICLGKLTGDMGGERRLWLSAQARLQHLHIIGRTGTGKTTLMHNLLAQDIFTGHGTALLDPHGDLAFDILDAVPPARTRNVIYFNPSDLDRPVGFNPLSNVPMEQRAVAADDILSAFKHQWSDSWGPRLEHILFNAVRLLLDMPRASLLAIPRLLTDNAYRKRVLQHASDPVNIAFWKNEFDSWNDRYRTEAIAPVLNKVNRFLSAPAIRNCLGQTKHTIDLRRVMDDGQLFIANLSKGRLGEGHANLLGGLLVSSFQLAAQSRTDLIEEERRPFYLYADEFQNYTSKGFATILSEARKFGLGLTIAHQYLDQLPDDIRSAILGNTGSTIAFRIGGEDAQALAREFDNRQESEFIETERFTAQARILNDGNPYEYRLLTEPPYKGARKLAGGHRTNIIKQSAERFGYGRKKVERETAHFFG